MPTTLVLLVGFLLTVGCSTSLSMDNFFSNGVHFNPHKMLNNSDLSELRAIALGFCGLEFAWKQNSYIQITHVDKQTSKLKEVT